MSHEAPRPPAGNSVWQAPSYAAVDPVAWTVEKPLESRNGTLISYDICQTDADGKPKSKKRMRTRLPRFPVFKFGLKPDHQFGKTATMKLVVSRKEGYMIPDRDEFLEWGRAATGRLQDQMAERPTFFGLPDFHFATDCIEKLQSGAYDVDTLIASIDAHSQAAIFKGVRKAAVGVASGKYTIENVIAELEAVVKHFWKINRGVRGVIDFQDPDDPVYGTYGDTVRTQVRIQSQTAMPNTYLKLVSGKNDDGAFEWDFVHYTALPERFEAQVTVEFSSVWVRQEPTELTELSGKIPIATSAGLTLAASHMTVWPMKRAEVEETAQDADGTEVKMSAAPTPITLPSYAPVEGAASAAPSTAPPMSLKRDREETAFDGFEY
jgi:hypothetical protein